MNETHSLVEELRSIASENESVRDVDISVDEDSVVAGLKPNRRRVACIDSMYEAIQSFIDDTAYTLTEVYAERAEERPKTHGFTIVFYLAYTEGER